MFSDADIVGRGNNTLTLIQLLVGMNPPYHLLYYLVSLLLAWSLARCVYLLYFHPLASFPGPRRAALSTWWLYSTSKEGQAEDCFEHLHKKYNTSALRIAPNELHISDPALYHTFYSQRHNFLKDPYFYAAFNTPHSVFAETNPDLHRQRRKALNGFFSKATIRSLQDVLLAKVKILCDRFSETRGEGPVHLYQAFRCLTVDFITEVAFGESFNLLTESERNTFNAPFLEAFDVAGSALWDLMFFPIVRVIVNFVPPGLSGYLSPPAAKLQRLLSTVRQTVEKFRAYQNSEKGENRTVVFDSMSHLNDVELEAEAADILVAGSDTTATTLAVALDEMMKKPQIYENLRKELKGAQIKTEEDYDIIKLEQLPFLSACVKEALRCASAVPGRLPRKVPMAGTGVEPVKVDGKVVPSGVLVSMSAYSIHFNEDIWGPDAKSFCPERWLTQDAKNLERYLVSFSKGARQCIGINLAQAELTMSLAMLASRFHFTRDETLTEQDLHSLDQFTVAFKGTGVRAHISTY